MPKKNNTVCALLPMKAHSERVPNKNIHPFVDRPLYHHIMGSLLASNRVEKVFVDTDGDFLKLDIKKHFPQAIVIDRPDELIGDFVSMNDILAYDIKKANCTHFLQTHSTNPLLSTNTIDRAVDEYFSDNEHDSLFSVNKTQTRFYDQDAKAVNHDPEELIRTQDLPPLFEENSNLYIFSKDSFAKAGNKRIGKKAKLFEMDPLESVDIDNRSDLYIAEAIYRLKK